MLAASRSLSSAICLLLRVAVPSRIIVAVTLARPIMLAGSSSPPAPRMPRDSEICGSRWSSRIRTVRPLSRRVSTGLGSLTFSTSCETGALFLPISLASFFGGAFPGIGIIGGVWPQSIQRPTGIRQISIFRMVVSFCAYALLGHRGGLLRQRDDYGTVVLREILLRHPHHVLLGDCRHFPIRFVDHIGIAEIHEIVGQGNRAVQRALGARHLAAPRPHAHLLQLVVGDGFVLHFGDLFIHRLLDGREVLSRPRHDEEPFQSRPALLGRAGAGGGRQFLLLHQPLIQARRLPSPQDLAHYTEREVIRWI